MTAAHSNCLVCYDIAASQRRLTQVRQALLEVATPVQYSVFLGRFTRIGRKRLVGELARLIDPRRDDVRIYTLPERPALAGMGRPILPDGVFATQLLQTRGSGSD